MYSSDYAEPLATWPISLEEGEVMGTTVKAVLQSLSSAEELTVCKLSVGVS